MEMYINNILDTNDVDKEHKLSFTNTLSLETLTNTEKSLKKNSVTPIKIKSHNNQLFLKRPFLNKDNISDIESIGSTSEKNTQTNKLIININDSNKKSNNGNFRYIENKENENIIHQTDNSNNLHVRKDIFGVEIKKGGKQRVSFIDNVQLLKSRMKFEEEINSHRKSVEINKYNSDNKIPKVKSLRRSIIDFKNQRYQLNNNNIESPKKRNFNLVEVIEVQNYKEYNKNEFLSIGENYEIKESNNQEIICCSGICIIF